MDENYSIRELSEAEFRPLFDQHKHTVFEDVHGYDISDVLSPAELERTKKRSQQAPYQLYLGVFDRAGGLAGWSWGIEENSSTFYMVNSAVLKEHRRQGLYRALLERCVGTLSEKGVQLIYSRHCATNNDVIIPKLQAGFIISKMEIDDKYGVLIHLHFYTNGTRRRIMDYRSGLLKPDVQLKRIFKI